MPGELRADLAIRPAPLNIRSNRILGTHGANTNGNGFRAVNWNTSNGVSGLNGANGVNGVNGVRTHEANGTTANRPTTPSTISSTNGVTAIPIANGTAPRHPGHKHARSSYSDSPVFPRNNSLSFRPAKRSMALPEKTVAVINASGRQAASLIRYATAVGYHVRAQMRNRLGVIATEVATNENVTVLEGELYTRLPRSSSDEAKGRLADVDVTRDGSSLPGIGVNYDLINELFRGAQIAFINTTFYGDEEKIGEALADAAKKAGIQHYVYSSMPDHQAYNPAWPSLPLWATKHKVEEYVQAIGLNATFVYTGIYNNNFTSLKYPLFCMGLQRDGSFLWEAPFHPDVKLPWLDAEHDVGPAILQIFKDGVSKWGGGKRIALAYEMLTPREACRVFARGVGRPVRYRRGPIEIKVPIPDGYRAQLKALEQLFFLGGDDPKKQPPYFGCQELDDDVPTLAMELWEGPRGLEEYAREVFPLEEQANGLTWMLDEEDDDDTLAGGIVVNGGSIVDGSSGSSSSSSREQKLVSSSINQNVSDGSNANSQDNPTHDADADEDDDDYDDDGLVMRATSRNDEEWLP